MSHTCHAPGCDRLVPPQMWGCPTHWFALPQKIRKAIWREYRPGQERDKDPSLRYLAVQRLACAYSVFRAHDEKAVLAAFGHIAAAMGYAKECVEAGLGDPIDGLILKDWPEPMKKVRARAKYL